MATKTKFPNILGGHLYTLLSMAIKTTGSYNPSDTMFFIEEQLTEDECDLAYAFLTFVYKNDLAFGSGNYEEVYSLFLKYAK